MSYFAFPREGVDEFSSLVTQRMASKMQEDTVSEMEKVSKILSASQSGDVDLFWAAAMQVGAFQQ